jgi:hypothetical protein
VILMRWRGLTGRVIAGDPATAAPGCCVSARDRPQPVLPSRMRAGSGAFPGLRLAAAPLIDEGVAPWRGPQELFP